MPSSHLISAAIRAARKASKLTQRDFAAKAGLSLRTLIRVEGGDAAVSMQAFERAAMTAGLTLTTTPKRRRPTLDELDTLYGDEGGRRAAALDGS